MQDFFNVVFTTTFGYSILRVTTPILFAALGALISDKAGVINIALEGIMLISALIGVIVSTFTHNVWLGLLGAIVVGGIIGIIIAYFSLNLRADIILTGIAVNLMAAGGTIFLLYIVAQDKGVSTSLKSGVLPKIAIPLIDKIPIIGPIFSGHNVLTYISLISIIFVWIILYKTALGLRIRAVGENQDAAKSVGINVIKIKYISLCLSGIMAGFGGAYMSMAYLSWFAKDMTAGRGFIALAAEAMGGATPLGTFLTSLLFGVADALSNSLQILKIPTEFVQMIPYVATIIGLVIYSRNKCKRLSSK